MAGADAGHGQWDHGSLLEGERAPLLQSTAATMDPAQATRASFQGAQTAYGKVVFVTTIKCGATTFRGALERSLKEVLSRRLPFARASQRLTVGTET